MVLGTWTKRLSLALLGSAALTLGSVNLSYAEINTFDPAAPGAPVPSSGGLTFDGFVSADGGSGYGGVAATDGSATVSPVPPASIFDFFGVDLIKPTNSSINFIQIEAFLEGSSLYTEIIDISSGFNSFSQTNTSLFTVSSLTFTGFASDPSAFTTFSSFAVAPLALASFSLDSSSSSSENKSGSKSSKGDDKEKDGKNGGKGSNGNGNGNDGEHGSKGNNDKGNKGKGYGNYCTGNQGNDKEVGCAKGDHKPKLDPDKTFYVDNFSYQAVPEPTTMLGLLVASGGLVALKRKLGQKQED